MVELEELKLGVQQSLIQWMSSHIPSNTKISDEDETTSNSMSELRAVHIHNRNQLQLAGARESDLFILYFFDAS